MSVLRFDAVTIRKPERTAQGFLRADAVLTRPGVFVYRNPDGSSRREYRPPEEVFRADALASFEDAPITVDHPKGLVTKENARAVTVGLVKESPRRDGDVLIARVLITDAAAILDVESGKREQVSCGYEVDYDPTPGVTPDGERYDGTQRNIRGNHLALVTVGRAGPEAKIRLDAGDAVMVSAEPEAVKTQEIATMAKVRLDGVDFEASEQLAQAFEVAATKQKERLDAVTAEKQALAKQVEELKARADGATDAAEKAKARADAAESPELVQKAVRARLDLERRASAILGSEVKLDAMDDAAVMRAVVLKVHPKAAAKLEGASAEYLRVRYDAALEGAEDTVNPGLETMLGAAASAGAASASIQARIVKARQDAAELWKKPLAASKDKE